MVADQLGTNFLFEELKVSEDYWSFLIEKVLH